MPGWNPFSRRPLRPVYRRGGKLIPEDFRHEQYLIVHEKGRRIVFSGCSHRGILNIAHWLKPDVLIGGFTSKSWTPTEKAGKLCQKPPGCCWKAAPNSIPATAPEKSRAGF